MKSIGRYVVLKTLDRSGLGDVFLAKDPILERKVAVKILSVSEEDEAVSCEGDGDELHERVRRAAKLMARLDHPGIETLYDFGEHEGRPYFVLEYLEGRSLAELVERGEMPPLSVTLRIMSAVAGALQHAHENGVIHRDIKPANIIMSPRGEPVLRNFLLAAPSGPRRRPDRAAPSGPRRRPACGAEAPSARRRPDRAAPPSGDPPPKEGKLPGTPCYVSPEQARGEAVTRLADIWSVGAAMFHVLAGRPLYEGGTAEEMLAKAAPSGPRRGPDRAASDDPVDLSPLGPATPEFVADIVDRCMSKDLARRYQSADELKRALEAAIDHIDVTEAETTELSLPREGQTLLLHVEYQDADVRGAYREYRIGEHIGGGRFGDVYRATEMLSAKAVALKFLKREWVADADAIARFRREATILSRLSHPNIVFVHNFGRYGPSFFIAMELLGKRTLCEVMEERGPMDPERAVAYFDPVLAGLTAVHDAGVVHRDLKPGNIAVVEGGAEGRPPLPRLRRAWPDEASAKAGRIVIFDFGMAFVPDMRRLTTSGFFVGTPSYASPEQASALAVTGASDVYAAGVILYEMLSGRLPHEHGSAYELLNMIVTEPPVPIAERRPDVPGVVRDVLDRMLAKDPRHRPDAAEARRLLAEV